MTVKSERIINCPNISLTPHRAMIESCWLTTTSTAIPIKAGGAKSKSLLSIEQAVACQIC